MLILSRYGAASVRWKVPIPLPRTTFSTLCRCWKRVTLSDPLLWILPHLESPFHGRNHPPVVVEGPAKGSYQAVRAIFCGSGPTACLEGCTTILCGVLPEPWRLSGCSRLILSRFGLPSSAISICYSLGPFGPARCPGGQPPLIPAIRSIPVYITALVGKTEGPIPFSFPIRAGGSGAVDNHPRVHEGTLTTVVKCPCCKQYAWAPSQGTRRLG